MAHFHGMSVRQSTLGCLKQKCNRNIKIVDVNHRQIRVDDIEDQLSGRTGGRAFCVVLYGHEKFPEYWEETN